MTLGALSCGKAECTTAEGPDLDTNRLRPGAEVRLLGGFGVSQGGVEVPLPADAQRLLAFLALRRGRQSRSLVAGQLWLDCTQDRAFRSLRSALWRLKSLTSEFVRSDSRSVALADHVEVDVDALDAAASRACSRAEGVAVREWDRRQFTNELLPGWHDEWALVERERLRQVSLHTLEAMSDRLRAEGLFAAALQAALATIELDPLRESSHRCLISIHLAEGNRSEAIRAHDEYADLLRRELDIEPSPKMSELMRLDQPVS